MHFHLLFLLMIQIHSVQKTFQRFGKYCEWEKNVSDRLKANKLSLEIKKTQFLIFKAKNKKISQEINIKLDD